MACSAPATSTTSPRPIGVGGYIQFDLYRHDYQHLAKIGVLFALNVIASAGLVVALVLRPHRLSHLAALLFTVGSLTGFVASRTVGLLGFKETGLTPSPQALLTVAAELAAIVLVSATAKTGLVAGNR